MSKLTRKVLVKYVTHITACQRLSPHRNYQLSNFTATKFHTKIQNLMTQFTNLLGIMPDYFWRLYTLTWTLRPEPCWCTHIEIQTVTMANTWKNPSSLLFVFLINVCSNDLDFCVCQQIWEELCKKQEDGNTHTHTHPQRYEPWTHLHTH
jgi:hypothetical protein